MREWVSVCVCVCVCVSVYVCVCGSQKRPGVQRIPVGRGKESSNDRLHLSPNGNRGSGPHSENFKRLGFEFSHSWTRNPPNPLTDQRTWAVFSAQHYFFLLSPFTQLHPYPHPI